MEALWVLVNVNQLIASLPLFFVAFPANTMLLFELMAFMNGDIFFLQWAYDESFGKILATESEPYNEQFQLLGY